MAYVDIEDFKAGLDLRRMQLKTQAGSLLTARNIVINRGGEIEKRKAFIATATLPADTFGLLSVRGTLYVFGSVVPPAMPPGYAYQRLQDPNGGTMTGLVRARLFGGLPYVVATFTTGFTLHFYNGTIVDHWSSGIVQSYMASNTGIATHLAALIDAHPDYSATASTNVITITGPLGIAYDVSTSTEDGDDETAVVAITQNYVAATIEVAARGSFTVKGGTASAGVNQCTSVSISGVTITSAAVDWTTSNEVTAAAIAANIAANVSSPDYTAFAVGPIVYIDGAAGLGATVNGLAITVNCAGDFIVSDGWFEVYHGSANPGVNNIDSVVANGITISNNNDWITSDETLAANIAAEINLDATYNAFVTGTRIFVNLRVSNSLSMGQCVVNRNGGNVDARNSEGESMGVPTSISHEMLPSVVDMANGVSATTGVAQISTVTIGGTFEVGDRFTITISDDENGDIVFGAGSVSGETVVDILPLDTKMYAAFGSVLAFSAVNDPTLWNYGTGSGFITFSNTAGDLVDLKAIASYGKRIAAFARSSIGIWNIDPDPDLNSKFQLLENIGTLATRSPQAYGGRDTYFLHDSGFRSLRVHVNSEEATTFDVGTYIDDEIVRQINSDEAGAMAAHSIIEPESNRYWCYLNGKIYVLTQFEREAILGWSVFDDIPEFTDFEKIGNRVYGRAGETVYTYGGADGVTYDTCEAEIELPYLNARKIATWKQWSGVDFAIEGLWQAFMNTDPDNPTAEEAIAHYDRSTYHLEENGIDCAAPAIKLRFKSTAAQRALISGVTVHYDELDAA